MQNPTRYLILIMAVFYLCACGNTSETGRSSSSKDIASDLEGQGGVTYLYWMKDTTVYRGTCQAGQLLIRLNCQTNLVTKPSAEIQTKMKGNMGTSMTQLNQNKTTLLKQLDAIDEAIKKDPLNADLSAERTNTLDELKSLNEEISALQSRLNSVDDFFTKLGTEPIVYQVMAGNDRYHELRPLVEDLATLFDNIWIDPVTKRAFIAIPRRLVQTEAVKACKDLQNNFHWNAINSFDDSDCGDSMELGQRLFASPIMEAVPETGLEGFLALKMVWSRCSFLENTDAIAVAWEVESHKIYNFRLGGGTQQLPVVCEKIR